MILLVANPTQKKNKENIEKKKNKFDNTNNDNDDNKKEIQKKGSAESTPIEFDRQLYFKMIFFEKLRNKLNKSDNKKKCYFRYCLSYYVGCLNVMKTKFTSEYEKLIQLLPREPFAGVYIIYLFSSEEFVQYLFEIEQMISYISKYPLIEFQQHFNYEFIHNKMPNDVENEILKFRIKVLEKCTKNQIIYNAISSLFKAYKNGYDVISKYLNPSLKSFIAKKTTESKHYVAFFWRDFITMMIGFYINPILDGRLKVDQKLDSLWELLILTKGENLENETPELELFQSLVIEYRQNFWMLCFKSSYLLTFNLSLNAVKNEKKFAIFEQLNFEKKMMNIIQEMGKANEFTSNKHKKIQSLLDSYCKLNIKSIKRT